MTKMATMPMPHLMSSTEVKRLRRIGRKKEKHFQDCSNDDYGLTLTYIMARSDFVLYAFVREDG